MHRYSSALLWTFLAVALVIFYGARQLVHSDATLGGFQQAYEIATRFPEFISAALPWDVGGSAWLLWASVALFLGVALVAAQIFGLFCSWIVGRLLRQRFPDWRD